MPKAVVFDAGSLGTAGVPCGGFPEDSRLPPQSSVLVPFSRSRRLGLLTAGRELLAGPVTPMRPSHGTAR